MSVRGVINLVAALFQAVFEILCDLVIIFDNENPHTFSPLVVTEQSVAQSLQVTAPPGKLPGQTLRSQRLEPAKSGFGFPQGPVFTAHPALIADPIQMLK